MDTPLPFPRRGLNDAWAFSGQPDETTRSAKNMRGVDPTNGRIRGAQRAGLSKHYENLGVVPGSSPVLAFESIVYDHKSITYDSIEDADLEAVWAEKTEPNKAVRNIRTDASGNLYCVVEKTVEKRNPDGKLLWAYTVPVDNELFTLGPLAVGVDLGVYVAVDGGAPGADGAAVYRISQDAVANSFDTEPTLWWAYQTDRFIREIALRHGDLLVLEQDDIAHRSYVTKLAAINLPIPTVVSQFDVPWPSTGMVAKDDGSVVTGHPYTLDRKKLPLTPGVTIGLESWRLEDLDNWEDRVWSWYRAQDLLDQGLVDDGGEIKFWPDRSGNGRNLYNGAPLNGADIPGPTLDASGSFVEASARFDGVQGLFSFAGGGKDAQRDACKTMLPNHGDGAFCTFIVCRPKSQEVEGETDGQGNPVLWRRKLLEQTHHLTHAGAAGGTWDTGPTGAYISGLILNSGEIPLPGAPSDVFCWNKGQHVPGYNSLAGSEAPGYLRAYTSSSGNRMGALYAGMPLNQGATTLRGAWTKEGLWDDTTATGLGEGMTIIAFMHCGGLSECRSVTGTIGALGQSLTLDDPDELSALYDLGATFDLYIGTTLYGTGWGFSGPTILMKIGAGAPIGAQTVSLVPADRNQMTRSAIWINGVPIDRWEALPMAYKGMNSVTPRDYELDKNVAASRTGLGWPDVNKVIKGYMGEVVEVVTVGRRQTNEDMVTLGGEDYHAWPTVLEHPLYASNQDGAEVDEAWTNVQANVNSTEFEKIYGWLAHRHGLQDRLPDNFAAYPHPHYPAVIGSNITYDIPLADGFAESGQAWVPRKREDEAMVIKHDASGKMLWCLLASIQGGNGDLFSENMLGNSATTTARATGCVALGPDGEIYIAGPGAGTNRDEYCMGVIYDDVKDDRTPVLRSVGFYKPGVDTANLMDFPADTTIRGVVDAYGNLHIPIIPGTTYLGAAVEDALRTFTQDGDILNSLAPLGGSGYQNAHAVALPPDNPEYYTD